MRRANLDVSFLEDATAATFFSVPGRVLTYLLIHHNLVHGAYPGRQTISRSLGVAERSVTRALRELERDGWLRRDGMVKGKARYYLPVSEQGYLQGGPDKWAVLEQRLGAAWARQFKDCEVSQPRQEGAALSSPPVSQPRQEGAALSSPLDDAPARQIPSGDNGENEDRTLMNTTMNTSEHTPAAPGVCINARLPEPETPSERSSRENIQSTMDQRNRSALDALPSEQRQAREEIKRKKRSKEGCR
jgi:hypothetical protein